MTLQTFARLSSTISVGATVTFVDNVIVTPSEALVNARKLLSPVRRQYMCSPIDPDDATEIQKIIMAHYGRRYPFAMRDWLAYQYTNEVLAHESTTLCTLQKVWQPSSGDRIYTERVLIPDETEVATVIKVNGTPLTPVTGWNFANYGKVLLTTPVAGGDVVTVTGQYLKAVVFADNPSATLNNTFSLFADLRLNEITEAELTQLLL